MGRIEEMLVGASKDFDLAKRYKNAGEFTIAELLYAEALEKVFTALFIRGTGNAPPSGTSISYLATKLKMPRELFDETTRRCVDDEQAKAYVETDRSAEERALYMESAVKRLLDYGMAYVRA
jgi:HEPN domain-containing protein